MLIVLFYVIQLKCSFKQHLADLSNDITHYYNSSNVFKAHSVILSAILFEGWVLCWNSGL
ncbi:MAG: hypothetical protein CML20_06295 [Rheinheimera sp.]|nr:hypothetical protein [Rheinheimera sp.]